MARKLDPAGEENLELKAIKGMEEGTEDGGDVEFGSGAEVSVESNEHGLRKPKYCNRIYFKHDTPPPKMVKGYKFNIFYPELLMSQSQTKVVVVPNVYFEKDGNSKETCIILFKAGPPYQDIAFRIVNKELGSSRITFENGIFRVYFNFKRFPYRR